MRKLQEILRKPDYYIDNYDVVIYADNGKQVLESKVIPRIVRDALGVRRNPPPPEFVMILDEDEEPLDKTLERIKKNIESWRINASEIKIVSRDSIHAVSTKDERYGLSFAFFLIPNSLEIKITRKALERRLVQKYQNTKQHGRLKELATKMGIGKEELIRLTIRDGWFDDEDWFKDLKKKIEGCLPHALPE